MLARPTPNSSSKSTKQSSRAVCIPAAASFVVYVVRKSLSVITLAFVVEELAFGGLELFDEVVDLAVERAGNVAA